MQLHQLREQRAARVQEARALLASMPTLTPEAQTKFDAIKAEIVNLEGQEARAQFVEDAERRSLGAPVDKARNELESKVTILDAVNAQIEQRGANGALGEYAAEMKRQGVTAKRGGILVPSSLFNETRATQTTASHPAILPDSYRPDQFVGLLRNALILKSLNATVLTGLSSDVVIPRQTAAGSAFWVQENAALTESAPTFDSIRLEPKTVGALTSFSRQLLAQANPSIENLLRQDMVNVVGLAIDRAALHGLAVNNEPVGIINTAGIQTASLATLSWATIIAMLEKLGLENVTPTGIVTHAKAATKLQTTLKDATSGSAYLMQEGRMAGLNVVTTNQLDAKTGTPNKGRVLVGDFSSLIVGEFGSAEILANPYAAGFYEKGAIQLRIMASVDMAVRNAKSFVLADDLGL